VMIASNCLRTREKSIANPQRKGRILFKDFGSAKGTAKHN
jgi:hypothetical protein